MKKDTFGQILQQKLAKLNQKQFVLASFEYALTTTPPTHKDHSPYIVDIDHRIGYFLSHAHPHDAYQPQ